MGSCASPAMGSSACPNCRDISSDAKLAASSPYKEKSLLSANLAFLASSPQGLKSHGLPQGRRRSTCGWGHGRGKGGSFDPDYESKSMIQTMSGAAQLVRGCAATQKPPLLKDNPCFRWFCFFWVHFRAGLSHRCPNTSSGKESSGKGLGQRPGSLLAGSLRQAIT